MPRQRSDNTDQVVFRVPAGWLDRFTKLIPKVSSSYFAATRTDVMRAALLRGLEAIEAEPHDGARKGRHSA